MNARDPRLFVIAHRSDDIDLVAVPCVSIGNDGTLHGLDDATGVAHHFHLSQQANVGSAEQRGGGSKTAHVDDLHPSLLRQPCGHCIVRSNRQQRLVSIQ